MDELPLDIISLESGRAIDRAAIEQAGIPGYTLMTLAAQAALRECLAFFPDRRRWQIVCGAGNNAGDGYVLARLARQSGIEVSVLYLSDPAALTGDAAQAYADFAASGAEARVWEGQLDEQAELIVDAILGSGLDRDVGGAFADAINAINAHPAPVVAIDIPSGIHGESGKRLGTAIEAALTVCFVSLKPGLFLADGIAATGRLRFDGLGIPQNCRAQADVVMRRIDEQQLHAALPPRRKDANKGDFGHVIVIGGGRGMPGAVRLCAEAALRTGAGKVSVATWPGHADALLAACPELMVHGVEKAEQLLPLLDSADVIAFGPGLGRSAWSENLYAQVAGQGLPAVWDADALNLLAAQPEGSRAANVGPRIITPHPGEAARLLNLTSRAVQDDRLTSVQSLQRDYGGVAVLKGAASLVATANAVPLVCTAGNPGMATAGMGDVLTGVIAALLAQGLPLESAAPLGVLAHALAGDRAARQGERGMLASDLLRELRAVVNGQRDD